MRTEKIERLKQQLEFIIEIDKVKNIFRQTLLADGNRRENDAEHSWHIALMAVLLQEYLEEPVDVKRVMQMVLIHDLVEIDAGDTYAYDAEGAKSKRVREEAAADRIFGMLPNDQEVEFRALWEEFEAYETPDAQYAHLLDNFQPMLLNHVAQGVSWKTHGVYKDQIYKRNERIEEISKDIWEYMQELIEENIQKGNIKVRD